MVPEDLLFWIAPLSGTPHDEQNVLCLRHADAMSVPRGWTLDDRREEIPRLFKPRPVERETSDERAPRRRRPAPPEVEQLQIDGTGEIERPPVDDGADAADADEPPSDAGAPWAPSFDQDSDLDGVLQVSSPLLARAFRGTDRPRD